MPQMSPLMWLMLFLFFLIIFIFFNILNFFNFKISNEFLINNISKTLKYKSLYWKW